MGFRSAPDSQTAELLMSQFRDIYTILAAVGDETRLHIIAVLASDKCGGMRVGEITARTHLSRPAVSHHLKILLDAEVIGMTPEGTKHFYYLQLKGAWPTLVKLVNNIEKLRMEKSGEE